MHLDDLNEMASFQKGRLILINLGDYEKNVFQIESVYKMNSIALSLPVYEVVDKTDFDFTITELVLKSKKEKLMETTLVFERENDLKMAHPVFAKAEPAFPMCLFPLEVKNEILNDLINEELNRQVEIMLKESRRNTYIEGK